ncbi:MAG: toxin [bacterium]
MIEIRWDLSKSNKLKKQRGVSFEEIVQSRPVAVLKHPKRIHQNILLFEHNGYIWVAPYVKRGNEIFLKTLFPSRKYTKIWKRGEIS